MHTQRPRQTALEGEERVKRRHRPPQARRGTHREVSPGVLLQRRAAPRKRWVTWREAAFLFLTFPPRPGLQGHLRGSAAGNLIEQAGGRARGHPCSSGHPRGKPFRTEQRGVLRSGNWGADLSAVVASNKTPPAPGCVPLAPPPAPLA